MHLSSLQEETLLLGRLIGDLQELSLAEAGQLSLHRQPLALAESIKGVVQSMSPLAGEKHITIQVDLPPILPAVHADSERIGQILRNLLSNAITHTPEQGMITIRAACETQERREIQIQVQDTGPGIATHHLPFLFERFYRADTSRSRRTGGTGLGLAIVK